MNQKKFTVLAVILLLASAAGAQSLSINNTGTPANNSSILDVSSTTKGVLVPRMTKVQKNAIATPASGLLVYQGSPDSIGFHYYNGTQWIWLQPQTGESTTADNGLTLTVNNVQLGGALLNNTTITQGVNNLFFDLTGTGNFAINKSGQPSFVARSNGNIGVNVANPLYSFHVVNINGSDGPFGRGIIVENTSSPSTGEASIAFKNRGTNGLPTYAAWMAGINNFTNYVVAYGDSLKGNNVKFKIDTLGNVGINTLGNPPESKLDVRGSFGNAIDVISVSTTLDINDHTIIIANGTGAITVTLPGAATCLRREYVIVNRSNIAQTITQYNDFAGTSTTVPANSSIAVQSNGSSWFRIR